MKTYVRPTHSITTAQNHTKGQYLEIYESLHSKNSQVQQIKNIN